MREGLHEGDCLEVLRKMADASVDAIVTDPPYGMRFMGKRWDYDVPSVEIWAECLRVLKPGGHLLAFAGTRTQHRMAVRIEDAGFEIRDMIAWIYSTGFPKSPDVSKEIDKKAGAARGTIKVRRGPFGFSQYSAAARKPGTMMVGCDTRPWIEKSREVGYHEVADKNAVTDEAKRWRGWGTTLKPALEPITMARKPLEGTVAANVLQWGTGGINVDGCRVETDGEQVQAQQAHRTGRFTTPLDHDGERPREYSTSGRWPANLIHDGSEEAVGLFPSSQSGANPARRGGMGFHGAAGQESCHAPRGAESGSAARFFYCAKASQRERGEGNAHPTVKPIALMRYLCRLVTPPNGLVLDPFMGTGTTGLAAREEGFRFVGIERDAETCETARWRLR